MYVSNLLTCSFCLKFMLITSICIDIVQAIHLNLQKSYFQNISTDQFLYTHLHYVVLRSIFVRINIKQVIYNFSTIIEVPRRKRNIKKNIEKMVSVTRKYIINYFQLYIYIRLYIYIYNYKYDITKSNNLLLFTIETEFFNH